MIVQIKPERAVELIDKISRFLVQRKMAAPAIMTIESLRPLHNLASQLLYFLSPFAEVIFQPKEYQEFAALLENGEYIELLVKRIDELDVEFYKEERELRRKLSRRRRNKIKLFFRKMFKKK